MDDHARTVSLVGILVDGIAIARASCRVFDGVENVGKARVQFLLVFSGYALAMCLCKSTKGMLELMLLAC